MHVKFLYLDKVYARLAYVNGGTERHLVGKECWRRNGCSFFGTLHVRPVTAPIYPQIPHLLNSTLLPVDAYTLTAGENMSILLQPDACLRFLDARKSECSRLAAAIKNSSQSPSAGEKLHFRTGFSRAPHCNSKNTGKTYRQKSRHRVCSL